MDALAETGETGICYEGAGLKSKGGQHDGKATSKQMVYINASYGDVCMVGCVFTH